MTASGPDSPAVARSTPTGCCVHPLLTAPPVLSLWRAPTDNDQLGGMAAALADRGLDALVRKPGRRSTATAPA